MESVWSKTAEKIKFPTLKHDIKTDVLIIGGGITGILCAYMLEQSGIKYILVEADEICGGITQNTTAKITVHHGLIYDKLIRTFDTDTAKKYFEANNEALKKYFEVCRNIDCDFEVKDNYVYSLSERIKLEKELSALSKIGADADFVNKPNLPFSTVGAVRMKHQAHFNPLKFLFTLSKHLRIFENTKVLEFVHKGVLTNRGKISADKIIVATHFPLLNKHGAYFLKLYQHRSYVTALKNAEAVDGMYVDEAKKGLSFRNYKDLLLLGGGSHRTGKKGGNWEELEAFARYAYPNSEQVCRFATQDCMSLDGIPYIGQYSKQTPNLYVATGFNKWGMTSAMVAAMILNDAVLEKENPYKEVFSPSRTVLRPQLALNAAETTLNLLTPTVPRCPHMGCALKYNRQEHSWDCPCHGSRFTDSGQLIDNPATDDIEM